MIRKLQQYLPLAVLKLELQIPSVSVVVKVATVLTACGIETFFAVVKSTKKLVLLQQYLPLAVLKPYI